MKTVVTAALLLCCGLAHAGACAPRASDITVSRLVQTAPWQQPVVVAGCYEGMRHGIALQDCRTGSGLLMDFSAELNDAADIQAFRHSAFRMPGMHDAPSLSIRVSGRLVKSDSYVPGGAVFLVTALHCFTPLAEDARQAPPPSKQAAGR